MADWRKMREERESALSRYAKKSAQSLGRVEPEPQCPMRTDFERDHHRILYSVDFRRLRHKTQVFFNTRNDHICTRMEHVLYVGSISSTIARTLGLNQDLAYAIALGHDLGHAPFGHTGERALDECVKRIDPSIGFEHETHSLRVVDRLASRRPGLGSGERGDGVGEDAAAGLRADAAAGVGVDAAADSRADAASGFRADAAAGVGEGPVARDKGRASSRGLNLTFEVRDGIVCHCGEEYKEFSVRPDFQKAPGRLAEADIRRQMPATLEGCVVRLVDKIAYVGRDIEDALRAGVIDFHDFSRDALSELGFTNGQIINTLVSDLVDNSYERGEIKLSEGKGEALERLIMENVRLIYRGGRIEGYEKTMRATMEGLFGGLYSAYESRGEEGMRAADERVLRMFASYLGGQGYMEGESLAQRTLDFVAGMTDAFALQCYEELYWL